jgi:Type II CAAX prenyl endopeptidase Rce1-like
VLWGVLMFLYPVLSVYPQGIVYRAFLFARYRDLFAHDWAIVLASAVAFASAHLVFHNRIAILLTFLGGVIFAFRYLQTGSLRCLPLAWDTPLRSGIRGLGVRLYSVRSSARSPGALGPGRSHFTPLRYLRGSCPLTPPLGDGHQRTSRAQAQLRESES